MGALAKLKEAMSFLPALRRFDVELLLLSAYQRGSGVEDDEGHSAVRLARQEKPLSVAGKATLKCAPFTYRCGRTSPILREIGSSGVFETRGYV